MSRSRYRAVFFDKSVYSLERLENEENIQKKKKKELLKNKRFNIVINGDSGFQSKISLENSIYQLISIKILFG